MLRKLTDKQAEILQALSSKYLATEDTTKTSIEVTGITETTVTFWNYPVDLPIGEKIEMPWFEFALGVLAPVMFKSKPFNLNGIISKCILRPVDTQEDLLVGFADFDKEMAQKEAKKLEDAAAKDKAKNKASVNEPQ